MKKTVSFSKNATNVFFHILTNCNLKCRHCYINTEQHGKNKLSISEINAWLGIFTEKSIKTNVIFLGGEPTMHPDLPLAIKKQGPLAAIPLQSIQTDIFLTISFQKSNLKMLIISVSALMVPHRKPTTG